MRRYFAALNNKTRRHKYEKINSVKNVAIILDFVVSMIAAMIQKTNPSLSSALFGVSAVILLIAVVCVIMELVIKNKK